MRKRHPTKLHLLSVREIQTLGDGDHSDGGGLILRVRGESATFVFRFTAPSRRRREMGLGTAHRANAALAGQCLTGARDAAAEARSQLQRGLDPIEQRKAAREAAKASADQAKARQRRQQMTLARAARDYHERVIEPRLSAKHAAQWLSSLENHVSAELWHKPIASITAPELLAALRAVQPHERARNVKGSTLPETLRRIRQRLDTVFEDAMFHGLCAANPAAAVKRKLREQLPTKEAGEFKALPYREAPAFLTRVRAEQGVAARCLEFALLTAARTGEAIAMEWSEVDLQAGVWTVPAARMKAGEPHTVFLSTAAVDVLRGQLGMHESWVFPSPTKKRAHLSNMAMLTLLTRMDARGDTTVHGLCRATFSTWANETAAARPDVVEACLAHKEADKVRASYNRAEFNDARQALLQAWADYLAGKHSAKIVQLHAA